jgi:hypothetical protein
VTHRSVFVHSEPLLFHAVLIFVALPAVSSELVSEHGLSPGREGTCL